ncbi:MAG: ribose-5-phosphate isomerase RpiA [Caldilineaceae bacterium]|nr:ribose-5-phosphate isomerase RpiA [Caldilineaceae bacterium]
MTSVDELKLQVARRALDFVESDTVVGLGGGSTAALFVRELGRELHSGRLKDILGVPTALEVGALAMEVGIPLTSLEDHRTIDVCIDGADEADPSLNLIKGGGGFLTREKIVAQASRRLVIIADCTKLSPQLGTRWHVPLEVMEFGFEAHRSFLLDHGAKTTVRRRNADGTPYRTDQGNYILDADFGPIDDPFALAEALSARAGIVEHGLFLNLATDLLVASPGRTIDHRHRAPVPA